MARLGAWLGAAAGSADTALSASEIRTLTLFRLFAGTVTELGVMTTLTPRALPLKVLLRSYRMACDDVFRMVSFWVSLNEVEVPGALPASWRPNVRLDEPGIGVHERHGIDRPARLRQPGTGDAQVVGRDLAGRMRCPRWPP